MLLRKVCLSSLPRTFSQISRVIHQTLSNNYVQQRAKASTLPTINLRKSNEAAFISQFVPDYVRNDRINWDRYDFKLEENYDNKSIEELVLLFEELSYHGFKVNKHVTDPEFEPIILSISDKFTEMTDEQILKVLVDLTRFPGLNYNDSKYTLFWTQIDEECWKRSKFWRWPMLLKVLNVYFKLGFIHRSSFSHKAMMKLSRKVTDLPPRILIEMMFYQSVIRHKDVPMYDVEVRFKQVIDDLTIDEIGIVSLAFFKTETKIRDINVLNKVYERTLNELDSIKDITLVNIVKSLRYSSKPAHAEYMNEFLVRIIPYINSFSMLSCLHIALLGTNLQNFNRKVLEMIVQRFNKEVSTVRIKELERMSLAIALFDLNTESGVEIEFMKNVLKELEKRVDEIVIFPRCLVSTLHYLSIKGIYDLELIKAVLKEKFVTFAYGKNHFNYSREIFCLDSFTRINLKGKYEGPQLSEKTRRGIATYSSHYIPFRNQPYNMTHADRMMLDVQEMAEKFYGKNIITQVLPHFERPDIIFCFDENGYSMTGELLDVFPPRKIHPGVIFSKEYLLSQKEPFSENIDKYKLVALVIGGWNFYIRDTEVQTGPFRLKVDQLKLIGYNPTLIFWKEWIGKSLQHREDYLRSKIDTALCQ